MLAFSFLMALGALQATPPAANPAPPAPVPATTAAPSRQRLICRSRPVLGSRITARRDCRTLEMWRQYDNDMEQSRRDIMERGARGCELRNPEC